MPFQYIEQLHKYSILYRINQSSECEGFALDGFASTSSLGNRNEKLNMHRVINIECSKLLIYSLSTLDEGIQVSFQSAPCKED